MSLPKKAFARLACTAAGLSVLAVVSSVFIARVRAQQMTGRIAAEIDNHARTTIAGTHTAMVRRAKDMGSVVPNMQLHGISLVFNRSRAQEAGLQALIAAQQTPGSPFYHQWLTPDQLPPASAWPLPTSPKWSRGSKSRGSPLTGFRGAMTAFVFPVPPGKSQRFSARNCTTTT